MKPLKFKTAFDYPFGRAKGMWNIFWLLLPIIGWFALGGYGIRIIKEFTKGKFKKLPIFKFSSDLKLGFFMFLKAIPFILAYMIVIVIFTAFGPFFEGLIRFLLEFLIVPVLTINFFVKETVSSYFEFKKLKYVFSYFLEYLIVILKSILLFLVFLVMSVILVGIPANVFTQHIFIADFYRRRVR